MSHSEAESVTMIFKEGDIEIKFFDEIPPAIKILIHNNFIFNNYSIDEDGNVYCYNGVKYSRLEVDIHHCVWMTDISNNLHHITVDSLKEAFL